MEEVKIGEEIGHFFRGEAGNSALRWRYREQDHLWALVPHARSDLGEARIKGLRPFPEIDAFLCAFAIDGMAIGTSLGIEDRPALLGITGSEEKGSSAPFALVLI